MTTKHESKSAKADLEHLRWLIDSRKRNQEASLALLELIDKYGEKIKGSKSKDLSTTTQRLTAVCFSLWRAAFLADKTSARGEIIKHAREFLLRMVEDNAIAYPQDKSSREWTFNYYTNSARENLKVLCKDNQKAISLLLPNPPVESGSTRSRTRWNNYQKALEMALNDFSKELKSL